MDHSNNRITHWGNEKMKQSSGCALGRLETGLALVGPGLALALGPAVLLLLHDGFVVVLRASGPGGVADGDLVVFVGGLVVGWELAAVPVLRPPLLCPFSIHPGLLGAHVDDAFVLGAYAFEVIPEELVEFVPGDWTLLLLEEGHDLCPALPAGLPHQFLAPEVLVQGKQGKRAGLEANQCVLVEFLSPLDPPLLEVVVSDGPEALLLLAVGVVAVADHEGVLVVVEGVGLVGVIEVQVLRVELVVFLLGVDFVVDVGVAFEGRGVVEGGVALEDVAAVGEEELLAPDVDWLPSRALRAHLLRLLGVGQELLAEVGDRWRSELFRRVGGGPGGVDALRAALGAQVVEDGVEVGVVLLGEQFGGEGMVGLAALEVVVDEGVEPLLLGLQEEEEVLLGVEEAALTHPLRTPAPAHLLHERAVLLLAALHLQEALVDLDQLLLLRLGAVDQPADGRQAGQVLLGQRLPPPQLRGRLGLQAQEALVEGVGLPDGQLGVILDVGGHVGDLPLPELGSAADVLDQAVGELHGGEVGAAGDGLDVDLAEVVLLLVGVVVAQVLLELLQLGLEERRGQHLSRLAQLPHHPPRRRLVPHALLPPHRQRLLLRGHNSNTPAARATHPRTPRPPTPPPPPTPHHTTPGSISGG